MVGTSFFDVTRIPCRPYPAVEKTPHEETPFDPKAEVAFVSCLFLIVFWFRSWPLTGGRSAWGPAVVFSRFDIFAARERHLRLPVWLWQ
jgi:hypothetical protein